MSTLEESTPSLTSRSGSGRELWAGKEEVVEGGSEEQVWQERCIELEDSLARFRDQAHRIREILKEKVCRIIYFSFQMLLIRFIVKYAESQKCVNKMGLSCAKLSSYYLDTCNLC